MQSRWMLKSLYCYMIVLANEHSVVLLRRRPLLPDSSPSNTPGIPTRSMGIPSSASASIFNGCSRASLEAKPAEVYCPLDSPVFGMSRSFGGHGGGGSALEYRIRAI